MTIRAIALSGAALVASLIGAAAAEPLKLDFSNTQLVPIRPRS